MPKETNRDYGTEGWGCFFAAVSAAIMLFFIGAIVMEFWPF